MAVSPGCGWWPSAPGAVGTGGAPSDRPWPSALPAPWAEEPQAGASEERPAAPPLDGAGTARAACLARSPRAFLRIPIYNQKMNTDTVSLYPFLVRGVVTTFERIMVEDKNNPSYFSVTLGPLRCESSLT